MKQFRLLATLAPVVVLGVAGCTPGNVAECIAPANPGGGWDLTCRAPATIMQDMGWIEGAMRVTNMPGGGGGVAYAHVISHRNDDDHLIVAASTGTVLRLAQGQYGDFETSDVRWLAALAADFGVMAVARDAPYASLDELVAAWKANPSAIVFGGGSAVGGQDHMKVLLLARAANVDPAEVRYVSFDGGGEALTALLGGFVQVVPGDASNMAVQAEAGTVRVLAVLASDRLSGSLSDTPTARELGYDVEWMIFRGYFGPLGMSEAAYSRWTSILSEVARSEAWAEARARYQLQPLFLDGDAFSTYIQNHLSELRSLSSRFGLNADTTAHDEAD